MPNALQARHVKRGRGMAEIMTMNGSPLIEPEAPGSQRGGGARRRVAVVGPAARVCCYRVTRGTPTTSTLHARDIELAAG